LICVEAGFKSRGWRIVTRVAFTTELPLDDNCCSDQEAKNWRRDWEVPALSQIEWLAGGHLTTRRVAGVRGLSVTDSSQ